MRIWQTLEVYEGVCLCPNLYPKVSEPLRGSMRETSGKVEQAGTWIENPPEIAVRAGMSRNSSSQTITCICHCVTLWLPPAGKSLWKSSETAASPQNVPSALGPWAGSSHTQNCPSPASTLLQLHSHSCSLCPNSFPATSPVLSSFSL